MDKGEVKVWKPCQQEFTGAPGYPERKGQAVTILGRMSADEFDAEVGQMYRAAFLDGLVVEAFEDELGEEH